MLCVLVYLKNRPISVNEGVSCFGPRLVRGWSVVGRPSVAAVWPAGNRGTLGVTQTWRQTGGTNLAFPSTVVLAL